MTPPRDDEMSVVFDARAESRREADELERLKLELRAAYLSRENASEHEFVEHWPEICSDILRQRARSRKLM
jgi:hypothetical protein